MIANSLSDLTACKINEFDTEALRQSISLIRTLNWTKHVNRRVNSGGWDIFPLRVPSHTINQHPIQQCFNIENNTEWCNTKPLSNTNTLLQVLATLHCPLESVRLMRLFPHAHIKPHQDQGLSVNNGKARLHIPIESNDRLSFVVNNHVIPMKTGELWYINADQTHEVINHGKTSRINLVIDCLTNDWLIGQLMKSQHKINSPIACRN